MDFAVSFSSLLLFSAMFIWQPMQCDDMEEHSRPENKILMKAGLVGMKGEVKVELFQNITRILLEDEEMKKHFPTCTIEYIPVEFDLSEPSQFRKSMIYAQKTFQDGDVSVAIGPYIDHFTSPNYIITSQSHYLTTSLATVRKSADKTRIRVLWPDPSGFTWAVAQLMDKLHWSKVVFLSDNDFSPILKLRETKIKVNPIFLPSLHHLAKNERTLHETLRTLRSSEWPNFVLHSRNLGVVKKVLEVAKDMHLLYGELKWLVTYLNFDELEDTISDKSLTNIYGLQILNETKIPKEIKSLLNDPCHNTTMIELGMLTDLVSILLRMNIDNGQTCESTHLPNVTFFQSMKTPYEGILGHYYLQSSNRTNFSITIKTPKRVVGSIYIGEKDSVVNLDIPDSDSKSPFGQNETLRIVTEVNPPFIEKKNGELTGFSLELLDHISKLLNFTYKIDTVERGLESGTRSPLISHLTEGNASMAIGAVPMSSENERIISSSYSILTSKTSLLILKAKPVPNYFQFLWPFSMKLWFSIVLCMLVVALAMYLMTRFDQTQDGSEYKFDFKESLWYALNVLLGGGTEYSPQTTSTRTIIAFYWFNILILTAAYTANLAAYLTWQNKDRSIKTLQNLVDQPKVRYGILEGTELEEFFKTVKKDPYERMWLMMTMHTRGELVKDVNEAVKKVEKGNYAFIHDQIVNEYYAGKNCDLLSHIQPIGDKTYAFAFPKGAPYRDYLNWALLKLKEDGRLDELKKKWLTQNCTKHSERSSNNLAGATLRLKDMSGLFYVMGGSAAIATVFEIVRQIRLFCEKKFKCGKMKVVVEANPGESEIIREKFV